MPLVGTMHSGSRRDLTDRVHLGGAVASHVRVGTPLFSHVLFPVYIAALVWGGLYLRDARVKSLLAK